MDLKQTDLKVFKSLLLLILLCGILYQPAQASADELPPKNVLVLHSYHKGFAWTDEQGAGIEQTLKSAPGQPLIYSEYMDWKRYPGQENLEHFYQTIKLKYQSVHIDAIMTTDDAALSFAIKYRGEILDNAPIIFSGINELGVENLGKPGNITGVIEKISPARTLEMALEINPEIKNVYILYDNSESGLSTGQMVMEQISSLDPALHLYPLNRLSKQEIIDQVSALSSDSIVLMTTYYSDSTGRTVEFDQFSSELGERSSVPVYHIYDFGLNHGAFGGSLISGLIQGQTAAGLAVRILEGEQANQIPIVNNSSVRSVFDYNELQRFGVSVKKLPEGSEVINKPFSFYDTYKGLVLSIIAAFAVLVSFILILLFYVQLVKKIRSNLEKSNERFALATYGSDAVIWDLDMSNMVYYFSDSWYELLGYERDEVNEAHGGWRDLIHPEDGEEESRQRTNHLEGRTSYYYCEFRLRGKSGEYKWFQTRGKVLRNAEGRFVRFAGSMVDVTDRKGYESKLQMSYQELESTYEELTALQDELLEQYNKVVENQSLLQTSEEKYRQLAYNDVLSGLPNRLSLAEALELFIKENAGGHAALFFLDIDNFKYINDTLGHTFGDELLVKVGERLLQLGDERSRHFRFGGDEFVILFQDNRGFSEVIKYAETLVQGFKEPFELEASIVHISTSIGIAQYPENGVNAEELLKNADIAMYKAKEAGKGTYVVYGRDMQQHFDERMVIESHLRNAIANQELSLHYQPLVDTASAEIWGFEALIRWNSPALGFVSPLSFIKIAEDCRLIVPIGEWVLRTACRFIKELNSQSKGRYHISVNISVIQLMLEDFTDMVLGILKETGLAPQYLELEITESIFMESFEAISSKLEALKEKGIGIALDDFGTGYSSLSYLKQLPITTLKIDKSFIDSIDSPNNMSLARSIVTIGHDMGLNVTAEGVETPEQLAFLERTRCDKIQGYFISRPIPQKDVADWVKERRVG
ncbi:ABC transporter substrate binding protein [Paenibacillus typhae]|uniref:PAS domain S-box-containing protein/diguanylate cyclase (GGDEF) domain-containing protein n=1 Tax=Paenibacillus typhae TaxID=1174501 RepID=A0A1G8U649_9BACL|nr:ABC transporter substrate binding protein [Paenibacillus typhae]SDJ48605.1 PAS domain S-box-containing protein/diguanylate cyclase (GGDEF) domain-containing protein [Paenibacillus typhae]